MQELLVDIISAAASMLVVGLMKLCSIYLMWKMFLSARLSGLTTTVAT